MRRLTFLKYASIILFLYLCFVIHLKLVEERETGMPIQDDIIPTDWQLTTEMKDRIRTRKENVDQVCDKRRSNKKFAKIRQNTHEFLINSEHNLIWCNVFKAASSTWLWNFNLLAGYSEEELLEHIEQPLILARRKYPRPSSNELEKARSHQPKPMTFIIVRHPFHRLVSAFRDKILTDDKGFQLMNRDIVKKYEHLTKSQPHKNPVPNEKIIPSFIQFAQFVIDSHKSNRSLDIHWRPINDLCTPCLNHFDVIAKVETLKDDNNYIIFTTGIERLIHPKIINKSPGKDTSSIAKDFLCQLSFYQMLDLAKIYELDMELFGYDINDYIACTVTKHETFSIQGNG